MVLWVLLPVSLSLVSFIGTWTVYGLAYNNEHVCSLGVWGGGNYCRENDSDTRDCCRLPTISSSGTSAPENSLFTATISAGSFLFLVFSVFHHAHVLERHTAHAMLSRVAMVFGVVSALAAFMAGNCNPAAVQLLHYLGAAVSFLCICFYTTLLTSLTAKCALTGYERFLYPGRVASTVLQVLVTISYTVLFPQKDDWYKHLSAVVEWVLSVNLELFELSFAAEFCCFSSSMLSNLLARREEAKPLMMTS